MAKYLFLFTITPVQSFIAQARKAQDLFVGSQLLSDLIDNAIEETKNATNSFNLIFPNIETHTKPNRFVAEIEYSDMKKLSNVSEKIKEKLVIWAAEYFKNESLLNYSKEELNNILKPYWAIKELSSDYLTTYKELENLLGSIKNQRYFEQLEETGRKCSLNGEYNVKIYRKSKAEMNRPDENILEKKLYHNKAIILGYNDETTYKFSKIEAGEGLSAISFLKRVYQPKNDKDQSDKKVESFPSTAEIALLKDLEQFRTHQEFEKFKNVFEHQGLAKKAISDLIKNGGHIQLDDLVSFNDHFFYEENLNEKQIPNKFQREAAKEQLKIINKISKLDLKYYAVVRLDVDSMGSWLVHENATKDYHKKISEQLKGFANWVIDYVDGKGENRIIGRTLYSGGDDVLLLVNLHYLFETVEKIRSKFNVFLNECKDLTGFNINATLSGSIVIAHYKHPLEDVLNWSNKLEKQAKEVDEKNAFAIAVLKHSGEIQSTVSKWSYNKQNILDNWQVILAGLNEKDGFSSAFVKNLGESLKHFLNDEHKKDLTEFVNIVKTEIKRLVTRACMKSKDTDETKTQFSKRIIEPYINQIYTIFDENIDRKHYKLNDLLNSLYIIDFIYRKLKNYDRN